MLQLQEGGSAGTFLAASQGESLIEAQAMAGAQCPLFFQRLGHAASQRVDHHSVVKIIFQRAIRLILLVRLHELS
ncbi:hypothetical protein D3C84_464860 [compost metagenome]